MVEEILAFGVLSVLDSNPNKHFNVHTKWEYKRILQRRRTQLMETVIVMRRNQETPIAQGEEEIEWKFKPKDESTVKAETFGP